MSIKKINKIYEFCFHIDPEVSESEVKNLLDVVDNKIKSNNGEIISKKEAEQIDLAYPIKAATRGDDGVYRKFNTSTISSIKFELETKNQKKLQEDLKEIKEIFRSIFIEGKKEDVVFDIEDLIDEEEKTEKKVTEKQEVK